MNRSRSPDDPSCRTLLARYGPKTALAAIPWQELPVRLQKTCERFIDRWWNDIDIDQTIEASGLCDMTLSELLRRHAAEQRSRTGTSQRRRNAVCR